MTDFFSHFHNQEAIQILFALLPSTRESLESKLMEAYVVLLTRLGGQVEEFPWYWYQELSSPGCGWRGDWGSDRWKRHRDKDKYGRVGDCRSVKGLSFYFFLSQHVLIASKWPVLPRRNLSTHHASCSGLKVQVGVFIQLFSYSIKSVI